MNPFDSKLGKVHSQLNEKLKEFESLSSSQQLLAIYVELLKANHERELGMEELGLDENLLSGQFDEYEVELDKANQLSIKEQVYALKSLGFFEFLKDKKGVTIDEAALLLSSITGSSFSNYRKHIALKKTAELTPHKKTNKQKEVHRTLWEKLFNKEHGNTLLPKIDPIAFDKWVDSEQVTDKFSETKSK
jgi:hypothetical protein